MNAQLWVELAVSGAPVLAVIVSGWMNYTLAKATHVIVNNQRTVMLAEIDTLKAQIAILLKSIGADNKAAQIDRTLPNG